MQTNTQQAWQDWARREIRASQKATRKAIIAAVGDVMAEERQALRRENESLRARLDRSDRAAGPP
jgi:hypothetical protein